MSHQLMCNGPVSRRSKDYATSNFNAGSVLDTTKIPSRFLELLDSLNQASVEYMVVGGYAVGVHGYVRPTKDIDLWIFPDPSDAIKIYQVVDRLKYHPPIDTTMRLQVERSVLRLGRPPMQVDLMTSCDGCDWKAAWSRRIFIDIDGVNVPFISLPDLRAAKRAAGRHRDLDDLENLPPVTDD